MEQIEYIGMDVKILTDYRDKTAYNDAKNQSATLTSFCKHDVWVIYDENGDFAFEKFGELPNNYVIWDGESTFPRKKCGIPYKIPYLKLTDGTIIPGALCRYEPVDKILKLKLEQQAEEIQKRAKNKI
ncbi:hypothetical protein A2331_06230 [Candidatus Falkowbacteria bacterium RIFOXYB2_FULL_34_18]|uniref:Uncharacterized protein n=1 Tax=Candidatus Falkowbacteria bacterium RIFOXYD2_FULL_34_120 TaxID=1798007 RepID=A0A1F5TNB5_9BACT|nr:MAG: hypothetical protein A2331_06230 [Candidatus Falkowbacteria bacterium RIFOXYB2_FULL_34_18]OGF28770.1 MAG: hypothetical protein A2500_04470 [Candidatus Falkowbacteria bacterium RIFOXYC12_FULL_34_55]OGF35702.1 MAG: hypothetical protein A2466_05090 [Candidatus Falkowbacteria bacterium RIFOXYC2_FULL_34_220]OGF38418.1 MAG: hypothetical protein A2515_00585 [Candidatus Falkowbacteria bacterium RIFOXYD12_FULL_34_57]OGF40472.1 MAG: hypothetical protein A2531_03060 [Candidatus Falkowbacteria bact